MMAQLGIRRLRPGPSGNETAPNQANYDESKANPFPNSARCPHAEERNEGDDAGVWWKQRRPEIVEDFEREVVGRIPRGVPAVQWSVVSLARGTLGGRAVIGRQLVGRVTSATHPALNVNIQMTLVTPASERSRSRDDHVRRRRASAGARRPGACAPGWWASAGASWREIRRRPNSSSRPAGALRR